MGYVNERFSKRLKEIRNAAGLTQTELADILGVSRGSISNYENNERTPDIEFLNTLATYFELPIDFVIGRTDNIKLEYANMSEQYGLSDEACEILKNDIRIGNLMSDILCHDNFAALKEIYSGLCEHINSFDTNNIGYISFLITDTLETIINDSLCKLATQKYDKLTLDRLIDELTQTMCDSLIKKNSDKKDSKHIKCELEEIRRNIVSSVHEKLFVTTYLADVDRRARRQDDNFKEAYKFMKSVMTDK